jgi:two-component system sensor histidine kinase PrrB
MLSADGAGEPIVLRVEDDGHGVPAEERDQVFERFFRGARSADSGSGLGLALVAQQAVLHGGRVDVGDSPMGGALFRVTLTPSPPPDAGR